MSWCCFRLNSDEFEEEVLFSLNILTIFFLHQLYVNPNSSANNFLAQRMTPVIRDEIIMKKNIHEMQANTQTGYLFDENSNEHFGSVRQSPIIIERVDSNSNRANKSQLRDINNIQQQQHQVSIIQETLFPIIRISYFGVRDYHATK